MRLIKLLIWSILTIYFQYLFAMKFSIAGMLPNFIIPFIIFIHLRFEHKFSLPVAFLLGITFDLLHPPTLGLNTISFLLISYLVHNFHHPINKKRLLIVFLSIFVLNFVYYIIHFLFYYITPGMERNTIFNLLTTLFYNTFLSFISVYLLILIDKIKILIYE